MRSTLLVLNFVLVALLAAAQTEAPASKNRSQEKWCGIATYHDALGLAFREATADLGETLVTVQVLPSFGREYAFVFKRAESEVKLFQTRFETQLWHQLGPPIMVRRTRQDCLQMALAAKTDTTEISGGSERPDHLWIDFGKLHLQTDTCPRRGRNCVFQEDGTEYVIQTQDGRSLHITETGDQKDVTSENPALLDWIHAVLRVAQPTQQ